MAKSAKPSAKSTESDANVVRIKAASPSKKSRANESQPKKSAKPAQTSGDTATKNPFVALGRYFKGAWYELRQVRWPDRKSTWSLTAAVLVFTAFFMVLILLLDALFKYLSELMLG